MANGTAARAALVATVAAIAPSMAHQIKKPSKEGFLWCMFNCSLGFFLFSFQAHEKSALLPLLPALLLAPVDPDLAAWFPIVVSLSMWPLLRKDRLHVAYVAMVVAFAALADGGAPGEDSHSETTAARATTRGGRKKTPAFFSSFASLPRGALWQYVRVATFVGAAGLHGLEVFVPPPARFPYLHDLLVTSFCFALFAGAAAYGNKRQRLVSPEVDAKARAAPRATRASRRAQPAVADEWSLVRIAATPESKTTRRRKPKKSGGKR
jgi:alpha-1,3-glucosyltransferase